MERYLLTISNILQEIPSEGNMQNADQQQEAKHLHLSKPFWK